MTRRHKRSRSWRLGMPEVVASGLFMLVVVVALLTLRANLHPEFIAMPGSVLHAQLINQPYSPTPEPDKVDMEYEYRVEGRRYTGHFEGFWPQGGGLNALPRDEWPRLTEQGHPLTVMVDPANPSVSLLHHREAFSPQIYNWLAVVVLAVTIIYLAGLYPRWKQRG